MSYAVGVTDDAGRALRGARPFLASRPVEHNLILTLLHQREADPIDGRYWTVTTDGTVVGVGFHSPFDVFATLTPMPAGAAHALAEAIAGDGHALPGITADATSAANFAGQWTELKRTAAEPADGKRIYRLSALRPPAAVGGRLRPAGPDDTELLVAWTTAFTDDIGDLPHDQRPLVEAELRAAHIWIWEDDGPVSMAWHTDGIEGVTRVRGVYTPPSRRRRGYSAACVGTLSALLVKRDLTCMLYTDLANPTSNALYRRLGYEAVLEVLRYRFT
ncbi:MAG: GNAT family N-acetyltransferase [Acidimicrobiia bacterium]